MEYPKDFIQLVYRLANESSPNLKFIGQGSPRAKMLIVERDSHIDTSTPRGEGCYEMEILHNVQQWQKDFAKGINPMEVPSWPDSYISEENFNPLYPYKGLKNELAVRDDEGSPINKGVSKSWIAYQKLREIIIPTAGNGIVDFHQMAFLTSLSSVMCPLEGYSDEVKKSVSERCDGLFSDPYFKSFNVILMTCGRMVKDCHIDIEKLFDVKFKDEIKYGDEWIRYYVNGDRLLMLTSPIKKCSDALLEVIGNKAKECLMKPLMKYFVYYDGTDSTISNDLMGSYEHIWMCFHLLGDEQQYEFEVMDMIQHYGITEEWLDNFGIPRTLIGLFFNRYCHWSYCCIPKEFMAWFEDVRKGKKK